MGWQRVGKRVWAGVRRGWQRWPRHWGVWFVLGFVLVLGIHACQVAEIRPEPEPAQVVDAVPTPELPDWIEQISPTDEADPLAQIRIRFKHPLIPVESLESPDVEKILKAVQIQPKLPGQFRFLTPRMIGFQGDRALPNATRVRVTLKAGLADLEGHRLEEDLVWTFNTPLIRLTNLPGTDWEGNPDPTPIALEPQLKLTSNVELNLASLEQQAKLTSEAAETTINLKARLEEETAEAADLTDPQTEFNPARHTWHYTLTPRRSLQRATNYTFVVEAGLEPAQGNLVSETTYTSQVKTYSPLAFEKLEFYGKPDAGGTYGRFEQGAAQLRFNNGLVASSATKAITVSPAPKAGIPLIRAYDGDNLVSLNPYALEPDTRYTITIGADLEDQYGQKLGEPKTLTYETGNVASEIWAPTGLNIFPAGQDLQLNVSSVNLPQPEFRASFKVIEPADLVYFDSAYPRDNGPGLLPDVSRWSRQAIANQPKNQTVNTPIDLRQQLGAIPGGSDTGMLAYGIQARTNRYVEDGVEQWREPSFYGLVQLTNLGIFAQWFPESGLVWVHHLSDGQPVANAAVEIYRSRLSETDRRPVAACATGETDTTGMLVLNAAALRQCMGGNPTFQKPPELVVIAREGKDWAFTRTYEFSGSYGYGIDADWDGEGPISRGVIFSDRQLYQPNETVWLTGIAYYLDKGNLIQSKNTAYHITLERPDGQKRELGRQTTNQFGTFSQELKLEPNQPLGVYRVLAKADNGVELRGEFRVAEFKPPNFKVDLTLDREANKANQVLAVAGDRINATAQSHYLFGPPVEGGSVNFYVTRRRSDFRPEGWQDFSFGRQWIWPEEQPTITADVLQRQMALDTTGKASQTVTISQDLPFAVDYRIDVEVKDVSNLSMAASQTVTALPSDRLIGLKADFLGEAGKPLNLEFIVTNPAGQALAGEAVKLELQRLEYRSVTQVIEGGERARNQVEYTTVADQTVRSRNQATTATLTPPEAGPYRIHATFPNRRDEASATDLQVWVTGEGTVRWWGRDNNRLEVRLDKPEYQVGDTATALIQSPYPEGEVYFAVVRHDRLYERVIPVKGGAPQVQFPITPEMLPNAAVQAVLVRQGKPLSPTEPVEVENLARIGFAPFKVGIAQKRLQVAIAPTQETLAPGDRQTVNFQLTDAAGNPTAGQLTVLVVNEAVLQLSGYRPPDWVETVYAEQPIATRFSDNRPNVILNQPVSPLDKGWGYGGGFLAGAANTRVRRAFQPAAYYNGSVLTDAQGKAAVTFTLPDDLTTWRVMAVAATTDERFGQGEATFQTTQPLVINPILPQFARPGDRIEAGLAVTNTTGRSGNLQITGSLSGPIAFADGKPARLNTRSPTGTQAYRFPIVVEQAGEATVQFNSQLNEATDAFAVPLPIRTLEVTEQVVETGTTRDRAQVALNIDRKVNPNAGGLDVNLASTLLPEITVPAQTLLAEAPWPFLESLASRLAIVTCLQQLGQRYPQLAVTTDQPLATIQQDTLTQLQRLQRPDGGFAAWPGAKQSDPFVTPYVAQVLAQLQPATATGPTGAIPLPTATPLPPNVIEPLKGYLGKVLADPGQYDVCRENLCKAQVRLEILRALAALGDRRSDFLADIYGQRAALDLVAQIKLARYLQAFPDWQAEARSLTNQVQETWAASGRSTTVTLPHTWRWLSSPTVAQAEALHLALEQSADATTLDRLLQGLLNQQREGTWGNSYDTASALSALVAHSQTQATPPNFTATAKLDRKTLLAAAFRGYAQPNASVTVPIADLPKGKHALQLQKSGEGTLHYLVAYRYRLEGNPAGRLNGLRVSRSLHPANDKKVLQQFGLFAPNQSVSLPPGQVFDVGVEVITDHPVDHVLITDPLPAGLEAIEASFQTSTPFFQAQADSWQITYQTIHRDRVMAYADHLEPGVYALHYLVRSVTPGTFLWPGSEAHLKYAPEEFGRAAAATLKIAEAS
ncbi:alpha-2-macroglobulin family protein [Trichothermofontia sp.]